MNDEHARCVVAQLKRSLATRYPDGTDDTVAKITGSVIGRVSTCAAPATSASRRSR
ncbi:MAG: hypothetical protein U1A78_25615 [Polyangia bacterium]